MAAMILGGIKTSGLFIPTSFRWLQGAARRALFAQKIFLVFAKKIFQVFAAAGWAPAGTDHYSKYINL